MPDKIVLDKNKVKLEYIPEFDELIEYQEYAHIKNKREHYRLLSYISKQFNNCYISDFGTLFGASALALSQNSTNHVHSYDVDIKPKRFKKENITFNEKDAVISIMAKYSQIILLDVDPHYGQLERIIYAKLIIEGFKGILICDDIFLNDEMRAFWNSIKLDKYNFTDVGHATGTGIVDFGIGIEVIEREDF